MIEIRDGGAVDRGAGAPPPPAAPAATDPCETATPGVVVSIWQAFSEWQLEPDATRPVAVDEIEWELP